MKYDIRATEYYDRWLDGIRDETVKDRIDTRVKRAEDGNFGDVKSEGEGVYAMRFKKLGIRIYFCQREKTVYLLLTGGDKNTEKGQSQDITRAKEIKREVEEDDK